MIFFFFAVRCLHQFWVACFVYFGIFFLLWLVLVLCMCIASAFFFICFRLPCGVCVCVCRITIAGFNGNECFIYRWKACNSHKYSEYIQILCVSWRIFISSVAKLSTLSPVEFLHISSQCIVIWQKAPFSASPETNHQQMTIVRDRTWKTYSKKHKVNTYTHTRTGKTI